MSQQIKHLESPINFDSWTERASSAGKLNMNPAGKSPKDLYEKALIDIAKFEEDSKVKALTPAKQRDYDLIKSQLPELEKNKDLIILSQTAKSHLKEVYWANRTGIMRNIHSKYMENGKMAEPDAIRLISELDDPDLFEMGTPVYTKCDLPRQFNEHFQGECDIRDFNTKSIQDIKCSWDISTYYPHIDELIFSKDSDGKTKWEWDEVGKCWRLPENNIENDIYECQGIVYMELYGMSEFWLRYCLVDMPLDLLEQQFRWIAKDFGGKTESEAYLQACSEFQSQHKFGHLPINLRVCTFKIKRNNEKYLDLCRRVEKAREYLNWYSEEMFLFENPQLRKSGIVLIENPVKEIVVNVTQSEEINKLNIEIIIPIETYIPIQDTYVDNSKETAALEKPDEYVAGKDEYVAEDSLDSEPEEKPFPLNLDEIEKEDEIVDSIPKIPLGETDEFTDKIQSLKTIEDAVEFYMENSSQIDDTKYEQLFYAKKEALSNLLDAPKIKKAPKEEKITVSSPVQAEKRIAANVKLEPEKVYDGTETYIISDGFKDISTPLTFDLAKETIIHYLKSKFTEWTDYKMHRDGIMTFYNANRIIIERDSAFKEIVSNLSKEECARLVEIKRKEMLEMVNKM